MSQDLVLSNKPAYLQTASVDSKAFDAGGTPLNKLSIKGSRFRLDTSEGSKLLTDQTGAPMPYVDVIMLAAASGVSKTFYSNDYQEGSDAPPDCSSANGVVPSPDVDPAKRQHTSCATCPKNAWGSDPKAAAHGKKLKACRDSKRIAIAFGYDQQFPIAQRAAAISKGVVALLQIPGGSLGNLSQCVRKLDQDGVAVQHMVIRISFDLTVAYPKLIFKPIRFLDQEEYAAAMERVSTDEIQHIIGADEATEPQAIPPEQTVPDMPAQVAEPVMQPPAAPEPVAPPVAPPAFDPTQMAAIQGDLLPATQPTTSAVPTNSAPAAEVDDHGVVWDAAIHSSSKKKNADGSWKKRRGAKADTTAQTPAATPAAPAAAPPVQAPAPFQSAPGASGMSDDELQNALSALLPPVS